MNAPTLTLRRMPLGPRLNFMAHTKNHKGAREKMKKMLEMTRRKVNDRLNPANNLTPQAQTKNGNGHASNIHELLFNQPETIRPQHQAATTKFIDPLTYQYDMTGKWVDDMDAYVSDPEADNLSAANAHMW